MLINRDAVFVFAFYRLLQLRVPMSLEVSSNGSGLAKEPP